MLKSMLADAASILQQTVPVQTTEVPSPDNRLAGNHNPGTSPSSAGTGATPQANAVTAGTPVTIESIASQLEGLRAMARGFEAKACRVDEMISKECEINRVLLDSGATHPVIPFREDLKELEKVSVTLAGDGRQQWLRTKGGTLVVPPTADAVPGAEPPQTIIPLGALVMSLGCTVTWSKRQGLKVVHPRLGKLKTGVAKNTCPYVQERQALELINELEVSRLKEFEQQVQTLECELQSLQAPLDPTEALRNYASSGSRVDALKAVLSQPYLDEVPEAVKVRLAEGIPHLSDQGGKHILKRLPLPRPARRALLASSRWMLHLCSGWIEPDDPIRRWAQEHGCELLQVDVLNKGGKGWDLTVHEGVWSVLLWAAATGRIAAILSSPPSRTWKPEEGRVLDQEEQRTSENPWMSGCTSEKAIRESLLAVQDMFLWSLASVGRGGGIPYLREFIDPPRINRQPIVNFWDTNAWVQFQQWSGARRRFLESGTSAKGVTIHLSVGTNLDIPDAVLPLTRVPLDPGSRWTVRFKSCVLDALEGKQQVDLEELDRRISKGLSLVSPKNLGNGSSPAMGPVGDSRGGCDVDSEAEEQLIRTFEDKSEISSSEEESLDSVGRDELLTRAVQGQADKKRMKELEGWRLHLENGHVPFRRDCHHCILGSAVNMQHRRVKHPTSYTLSVDLFGPLQPHERGRDEESVSAIPHIKYGLVGAFRLPKEILKQDEAQVTAEAPPKVCPEDHMSDYEPSDPEDEQSERQPVHDTLGEIPSDMFEELFGESFTPADEVKAVSPSEAGCVPEQAKLPWDEEYLPPDDDVLQEFAEELQTPVEQSVLRFFVGLKSKSGADVAAAVQRLILHINQSYPVRVLHCDPGTEFASDRLRAWLAGQAVRLQHTLPTDKRSNGLAERTVGVLKSQARTHLSSAKLHVCYWPLAMRYACEMHNRRVMGKVPLPIFGQQVLHKVKKPNGALNELQNKWVQTRYMATHLSIPEGHVLLNEEGNLVSSKGFRKDVVDPNAIPDLNIPALQAEEEVTPPPASLDIGDVLPPLPPPSDPPKGGVPKRRVSGKSKVRFLDVRLRVKDDPEGLAQVGLLDSDYSVKTFHRVVEALQYRETASKDRRGDLEGRYILGAFCHGGQRGVTTLAKRYPEVVKFLNGFLESRLSEAKTKVQWTTILLVKATDVPVHRDYRNEWGTKNFIAHVPGRTELWTGPPYDSKADVREVIPDWESDSVRIIGDKVEEFNARNHHAVRRVPDWFLVGFTPLGIRKLGEDDKQRLASLRFRMPSDDQAAVQVKVVQCTTDPSSDEEEDSSLPPAEACQQLDDPSPSNTDPFYDESGLDQDLQEDSVTPIVGWDPSRDPNNVPELGLEEMSMEEFLAKRGVSGVYAHLNALGVETPADLPFLYQEDLMESGVPPVEARLIMKGIHPEGTVRPDNPNLCALRSGEVRLLDRRQRPLPWVFQNRTLDWRSPGPPVQGLGVRNPDGGTGPRTVDWELEEARRRGELPVFFNEPEEVIPVSVPSVEPHVSSSGASSSWDPIGKVNNSGSSWEDYSHVMYMQEMWDKEDEDLDRWPVAASSHQAAGPALPKGHSQAAGSALPEGHSQAAGPALPKGHSQAAGPALPEGHSQAAGFALLKGHSQAAGPALPEGHSQAAGLALPKGHSQAAGSALPKGHSQAAGPALPKGHSEAAGSALPKGHSQAAGSALPEGHSQAAGPALTEGHSQAVGFALPEGHSQAAGSALPEGHSQAAGPALPEGHSQAVGFALPEGHSQVGSNNGASETQISSPRSQVTEGYHCKAIRTDLGKGRGVLSGSASRPTGSIGVPIENPVEVFNNPALRSIVPDYEDPVKTTCARKVDDSMYTEDVEKILTNLESHLKVVYNVSPVEVRSFLERWIPAARTEVEALTTMRAIRRLTGQEATEAVKLPSVQVLPAKAVFTVKPDVGDKWYKRKCRVVGCGNYEAKDPNLELYASGVPADVLRTCLMVSSVKGYGAFITDVKNAFLRADLPESVQGKILLRPPRILEQMNITAPGEVWMITKAVYGLRQAPRWWGMYRDEVLSKGVWDGPSGRTRMVQSKVESNLWKLVNNAGETLGFAIIYVDDVMYLTSPEEARAAYAWMRATWECTPLEEATPENSIIFLGVEIKVVCNSKGRRGFSLGQGGYINELVRAYELQPRPRSAPLPRDWVRDSPEEELNYSDESLRKAQKITGELLWLSQRTRLDLAYSVSLMGSWCTKAPSLVLRMGLRILEFVYATAEYRLLLVPVETAERRMVTYTDASFSPFGGHSVTGIVIEFMGCPIQWKAKKQSLISLSTAESELISACEGVTLALSMESLLKDIMSQLLTKRLLVDNTAAISLAEGSGTQRTRHLRVRSSFVREMLENKDLDLDHCPGDVQLADIMTKVLPGPRHHALCTLLGLGPSPLKQTVAAIVCTERDSGVTKLPSTSAATSLLVLTLVLQALEGAKADEDYEIDPVSLDLYVMIILMILSVLFLWESGKHCLTICCRRDPRDEVQVNMVRDDEDQLRRERRQEAVRRAIEKETGDLRRRRAEGVVAAEDSAPLNAEVPHTSLGISVNVTAPAPVPQPLAQPSEPMSSDFGLRDTTPIPHEPRPRVERMDYQPSSSSSGLQIPSNRISEINTRNSATQDVGVQTDFYSGLTYEQMCEVRLLTTNSRTPSAVHIFPECHALRNVTSVQNRMFCRYCITSARQGF